MIHVRVVSPPDVTPQLRVLLVSDTGVMNLTVVEGAMQKPDGDAIQFDVLRGRANDLIARMRELGVDQRGSIILEPVSTSLSKVTSEAQRGRPRFDEMPAGLGRSRRQHPSGWMVSAQLVRATRHRRSDCSRRTPDQLANSHRRRHGGRT